MDVSVIFVNYKTKDLTINAIKSVYEKTEGIEFEIFVVDNNSQDGSIEAIEQVFPDINIIKSPVNAGFGAANNLAIKQARGKYILCLNTDTLLVNNAIKIMFDFMESAENQNIGACGGYLVNSYGKEVVCGGNFPTPIEILWKFGLRNIFPKRYLKYSVSLSSKEAKNEGKLDYITGADIFFRKAAIEKTGLFDEKFFMYYEETDLCKRLFNKKYKITLIETAKIIHFEGLSNKETLTKLKQSKKSEFYYFQKYYPNWVFIIKVLYIILYVIDWLFLQNQDSKEMVLFVLQNRENKKNVYSYQRGLQ